MSVFDFLSDLSWLDLSDSLFFVAMAGMHLVVVAFLLALIFKLRKFTKMVEEADAERVFSQGCQSQALRICNDRINNLEDKLRLVEENQDKTNNDLDQIYDSLYTQSVALSKLENPTKTKKASKRK